MKLALLQRHVLRAAWYFEPEIGEQATEQTSVNIPDFFADVQDEGEPALAVKLNLVAARLQVLGFSSASNKRKPEIGRSKYYGIDRMIKLKSNSKINSVHLVLVNVILENTDIRAPVLQIYLPTMLHGTEDGIGSDHLSEEEFSRHERAKEGTADLYFMDLVDPGGRIASGQPSTDRGRHDQPKDMWADAARSVVVGHRSTPIIDSVPLRHGVQSRTNAMAASAWRIPSGNLATVGMLAPMVLPRDGLHGTGKADQLVAHRDAFKAASLVQAPAAEL
ncbi:hypothetical protein [Mesorhizobium sp. M0500]|uniref:hypothetical protein n=1 Tax=Mesorhizobium sp. M0500 TaxID=2956953 RepID=UPI0033366EEF